MPAARRNVSAGTRFGSAFFGWLTATGLAVLLLAILPAAGVAFSSAFSSNVSKAVQASQNATGTAKTVGLVGSVVLPAILFVAYYCGHVAGRMARFCGSEQGFGVGIWAIIASATTAAVAATAGSKHHLRAQPNLPRTPVDEGIVTTLGCEDTTAVSRQIRSQRRRHACADFHGGAAHRGVAASSFQERTPAMTPIAGVVLYTDLLS